MSAIQWHTGNKYLIDEERRLAHRGELKRKLAASGVKKSRLAELEEMITRLDRDSDAAADEHQAAAGKLQSELDQLDELHISALLANEVPDQQLISRRREILERLQKLNSDLELRAEANRRAAIPFRRQWEALRSEIAAEQTLSSSLTDLCSPEKRQAMLISDLRLKAAQMTQGEADRLIRILSANIEIDELNRDGEQKRIHETRLTDWQAVRESCRQAVAQAERASQAARAEAMAE